jgi:hypothetical protein
MHYFATLKYLYFILPNVPIRCTYNLVPFSFLRVFANETSQFLAPYEASVKSRSGSNSPPDNVISNSCRAADIPDSHRHHGVSASHVST